LEIAKHLFKLYLVLGSYHWCGSYFLLSS